MFETRQLPFRSATLVKETVIIFILGALYGTAFVNDLLFHSLVELFSIGVAFSVFIIAWNSRRYMDKAEFSHSICPECLKTH